MAGDPATAGLRKRYGRAKTDADLPETWLHSLPCPVRQDETEAPCA